MAVSGCTPLPRTVVQVSDARGKPVSGFPFRVDVSDGIELVKSNAQGTIQKSVVARPLVVKTGVDGSGAFEYVFRKKQPSPLRALLPGADWVPNQWIRITPLRDLPKGSSMMVGIPNP